MFFADRNLISECSIDIQTELNRTSNGKVREPLFLKYSGNEYALMIPDGRGKLKFGPGANALIACTSDQKVNALSFSEFSTKTSDVTLDYGAK